MTHFIPSKGNIVGFIVSCVFLTICLVVTSTQFALGALIQIGVDISFSTRLHTTLHDLVSMGPVVGILFSIGMLIAIIIGAQIARLVGILPSLVFALAGFAAVMVTITSMKSLLDITAIAATRNWDGYLLFCIIGALTGYVYRQISARLTPAS